MLLRDESSGNGKQVSLNRVRARSALSYAFQGSKNKQSEKTNILET